MSLSTLHIHGKVNSNLSQNEQRWLGIFCQYSLVFFVRNIPVIEAVNFFPQKHSLMKTNIEKSSQGQDGVNSTPENLTNLGCRFKLLFS